jgi:VWFA-related protein
MRRRALAGVALVSGLLAVAGGYVAAQAGGQPQAPAQPAQPAAPTPTFRAGVNFVRVDVIATDKTGALIQDLKPEDFEVTEQGRPQKIETFKLVTLDGGLMATGDQTPRPIRSEIDEQREAARDDVRLFAIFLDDYHVKKDSSLTARNQIARFVDTQLGPSDMIGIMYPLQTLDSVLMTRDHESIMKGIQQFEGRKFDYTPRNSIEEKYQFYPTEQVELIRNQVSLTALKALIMHMGGLKEGRKALILVSEGYSAYLPPSLRTSSAANAGAGNPLARGSSGADSVTETRAQALSSAQMDLDLRDVFDEANHYNVSIYAVDPRGLAPGEFGVDMPAVDPRLDQQYLRSTMETLRTLADQTDGRAVVNRNDLTIGMKQIVRDTSGYYLLGYNSTFTETDGKFHEIKVRVKRSGVDVRARKGYWALNRAEAAAITTTATRPEGPPSEVQNAINAATALSRARTVRTWIGTERGQNGKTKVTFAWEPTPRVPGDAARAGDQPARIVVTAASMDGDLYFRGRVPEAAGAPPPPSAAGGAGGHVSFEAPPGKLQLRLSVEGSGSAVLDSEVRDVSVPDLTSPQISLSTPELFRARTVREFQQLKTDPDPVPTLGRDFTRTDRLFLRIAAYGPGQTPPQLTAHILSRTGQPMSELPVTPGANGHASEIDVPLAGMAAGEYVIEIKATGEGGGAQEFVGFRVTG